MIILDLPDPQHQASGCNFYLPFYFIGSFKQDREGKAAVGLAGAKPRKARPQY